MHGKAGENAGKRLLFNSGWRFQKDDPASSGEVLHYSRIKDAILASVADFAELSRMAIRQVDWNTGADVDYVRPGFDDSGWRELSLPHDWGIEGPFRQEYPGESGKLEWWGVGWYRKRFQVPASEPGNRYYLDLDGAMAYAIIWCNGQFAGGWPYGYASFQLDLTPHIRPGTENVLAIRLENPADSSRWYPGGGIYRNVWFTRTGPIQFAHWGTRVTTPKVSRDAAQVAIAIRMENHTGTPVRVTVRARITSEEERAPLAEASQVVELRDSFGEARLQLLLLAPRLWSADTPHLYTAVCSIEEGDAVLAQDSTQFGVRTIRFRPNEGFLVNGNRVPIRGVCNHHDLGALGAAFHGRAAERQLELLKEMGANAIRTAHNPPAPELLDLCDRMGFYVLDEIADVWRQPKKPNDYSNLFEDWIEKDLRAMVRRDRNHPCVVLWSIGNETPEAGSAEGTEIGRRLSGIVHQEDPTRPTTSACNLVAAGYNGFEHAVDVMGFNYKPGEYAKFHRRSPDVPLLATETASCTSSRGIYFFPVTDNKLEGRRDFQVSSYDLYTPDWAMPPHEEFTGQDQNPFVAGEFVWTGFDYLGEPTPYNDDLSNLLNYDSQAAKSRAEEELRQLRKIQVPSRSSYFGIIDLAGFKKDRFYLYQSRWRPDLPMAHIIPHWTWPERVGQRTPVHVYTSGDEAELFLNGQSLGRKKKKPMEYRLRWDYVVYQPGELRVVAYKAGQKWAETQVHTAGLALRVELSPDRSAFVADGRDLVFVTARIVDAAGNLVPRARNAIRFEVIGPGELLATDNGDPTDHTSFGSIERRAFNGLALAIVRSKPGEPGSLLVRAFAEALAGSELRVSAV